MKRTLLSLISAAALLGLAAPAAQAHEADSVTLTRTACFGACPIYSVEVREDGRVSWKGERFVEAVGPRTARIRPAEARRLLARFRQAGFFDLKDSYRATVTDMPTKTLSLTLHGRHKSVVDYAGARVGMPALVTELEQAVDATAGTRRWIGARDRP